MDPNEILKLIRQRPFEPFKIRLLDGQEHQIRHPEMALVGKRHLFVGLYAGAEDGPVDDWALLSVVAIASVHPMAA